MIYAPITGNMATDLALGSVLFNQDDQAPARAPSPVVIITQTASGTTVQYAYPVTVAPTPEQVRAENLRIDHSFYGFLFCSTLIIAFAVFMATHAPGLYSKKTRRRVKIVLATAIIAVSIWFFGFSGVV